MLTSLSKTISTKIINSHSRYNKLNPNFKIFDKYSKYITFNENPIIIVFMVGIFYLLITQIQSKGLFSINAHFAWIVLLLICCAVIYNYRKKKIQKIDAFLLDPARNASWVKSTHLMRTAYLNTEVQYRNDKKWVTVNIRASNEWIQRFNAMKKHGQETPNFKIWVSSFDPKVVVCEIDDNFSLLQDET